MDRPRYRPLDLSGVKTTPLASRPSKVGVGDFARPGEAGLSFSSFLDSLPDQWQARDFKAVVQAIVAAQSSGRPIMWGMGAHVIKGGLSPLVIRAAEKSAATALAINGAGAIHDVEIALVGQTSEDVEAGLGEGSFGMAEETGRFIHEAAAEAARSGVGLGFALGKKLLTSQAPFANYSILAQGYRLGIPVTVHVALGTDIVHMHPAARGGDLGEASLYDFRLFAAVVADLEGGVYLNVGSAVILPEVFLKALSLARNLGYHVEDFTTVNLDLYQHYRPTQNVVRRPTAQGGQGYALTGPHELLLPLLFQAVTEALEANDG